MEESMDDHGPLDSLAARLLPRVALIHDSLESDEEIAEVLAREALRWVEERLPTTDTVARLLFHDDVTGDAGWKTAHAISLVWYRQKADALLALLRERLGV